jgi:neutral ceramidase
MFAEEAKRIKYIDMKKFLLIALICIPVFGYGQKQHDFVIRAGFCEIGITPDKAIIMSGYGNRKDPFKGIHDSIYAQAMYLSQGDEEVLLITSDLIGHSHHHVNMLKGMIQKETGIPGDKIFVTAVHNHGGPVNGTYRPAEKLPDDVKDYVDVLYSKLLKISEQAKKDVQPVKIGYDKGECKVNMNRRAIYSEREVWLGRNPDGACDHDLDIIKFTDTRGKLLAVHINYPCHGTCTGQDNLLVTGDWPGISAKMIKEKLGGDVVVMVTAGASADINPIYGPNDNFRQVNAVAYGVASVALELIDKCVTTTFSELRSACTTATFPGKKGWDSNFPQPSVPAEDVSINFSAFRIGDIVMAGISGEMFTEIGMNVKKRSPGNTTIMTHCNGASGYICTDASYAEGGYEPQVSHLMPGSETEFENILVDLIDGLDH